MPISARGRTSSSTYFITSSTFGKRQLLQNRNFATLFLEVLEAQRKQSRCAVHAYVIMPDHFLTPAPELTLERSVQYIKGSFSFRLKKELGYSGEVWQTSFYDRRVRDWEEFERLRGYIHNNPARRGMPSDYEFSSRSREDLDPLPQRLKPNVF